MSLVILVNHACDGETFSPTSSNTTTVPDDQPQTTKHEEDNILLELSTNKTLYNAGETVLVTASIENLSPDSIKYTLSSLGYDIPLVSLNANQYFGSIALEEEKLGGIRTVQPMVTVEQLKGYEKRTREVVWDQKYGGAQAPPGIYQIGCYITLGDYYRNESLLKTISINLHINIVGSTEWITAERAKSIALAIPEIAQWREEHSGKHLVKEEPDGIYLLESGEWVKVSPEIIIDTESGQSLTLEELSGWMPEPLVLFDDESWLVTMATKLGNPPVFVKVWIDLHDGSVRDVQIY